MELYTGTFGIFEAETEIMRRGSVRKGQILANGKPKCAQFLVISEVRNSNRKRILVNIFPVYTTYFFCPFVTVRTLGLLISLPQIFHTCTTKGKSFWLISG